MPNMIEELGGEYVESFYRRALFRHDDLICQFAGRASDSHMVCSVFGVDDKSPEWRNHQLPNEVFMDMDKFAWPRLGYRDLSLNEMPPAPYYLNTTRSAQRGLRPEFLSASAPDVLKLIPVTGFGRDLFSSAKMAQTIFRPQFMPFSEGMAKLRAGDVPGFALSSDVAIAISVSESPDAKFDVLHRERVIGRVDDNDQVVVPIRFFKRTTIANLFEGRVVK